MLNKNENEKTDTKQKEENIEEKEDIISKLLENEKDFITIIKKILDFEFDDLFPKILNLPKIDFLNQLTSNVTYILTERFSDNQIRKIILIHIFSPIFESIVFIHKT